MLANNFKVNLFLSAWKKYVPVIRILIKKSAEEIQVLNMNRTDFEKDAKRKYGYKFVVHFVNGKSDTFIADSEIIQSFIYALRDDEITSQLLLKYDYSFTLNNKYQLEIKNNYTAVENMVTEPAEEAPAVEVI
jgi:hypothetical protein